MIFFYYLDTVCDRSGIPSIHIPRWHVYHNVDAGSETSADWFKWGVRHEEFKAGDYGTSKYSGNGIRKLAGYTVLHYVETKDFLEFEEYIKRKHKNTVVKKPARYLNQIVYGMTIEYYVVVQKP